MAEDDRSDKDSQGDHKEEQAPIIFQYGKEPPLTPKTIAELLSDIDLTVHGATGDSLVLDVLPSATASTHSPVRFIGSGPGVFVDPLEDDSTIGWVKHWDDETAKLRQERLDLLGKLREVQQQAEEQKKDLEAVRRAKETTEEHAAKLKEVNEELKERVAFGNLLAQVGPEARKLLRSSETFSSEFKSDRDCYAFVLAIDIRRSTELMLKAKEPSRFAEFIVSLCDELAEIVRRNFGVFDKFTGDGILAFFPEFFSGKDAGLLALKTAFECHEFFARHYDENRSCFTSVLKDVGLGIGIDAGEAHLVKMSGTFTLVGTPVVYACRMSGAPAGHTLLNQTAYEVVFEKYKEYVNTEDSSISVKHEGETLAYKVWGNSAPMRFERPSWLGSGV